MVDTKIIETLAKLNDPVFIDIHSDDFMVMKMDHGKINLRSSNHRLFKVKDIEIKKNKKYHIKCTCKEIGADVETIKVFRLIAYEKVKNV